MSSAFHTAAARSHTGGQRVPGPWYRPKDSSTRGMFPELPAASPENRQAEEQGIRETGNSAGCAGDPCNVRRDRDVEEADCTGITQQASAFAAWLRLHTQNQLLAGPAVSPLLQLQPRRLEFPGDPHERREDETPCRKPIRFAGTTRTLSVLPVDVLWLVLLHTEGRANFASSVRCCKAFSLAGSKAFSVCRLKRRGELFVLPFFQMRWEAIGIIGRVWHALRVQRRKQLDARAAYYFPEGWRIRYHWAADGQTYSATITKLLLTAGKPRSLVSHCQISTCASLHCQHPPPLRAYMVQRCPISLQDVAGRAHVVSVICKGACRMGVV